LPDSWPQDSEHIEPEKLVFLLQYLGTDYGAAVESGQVICEFEYQEMLDFSQLLVEESRQLGPLQEILTELECGNCKPSAGSRRPHWSGWSGFLFWKSGPPWKPPLSSWASCSPFSWVGFSCVGAASWRQLTSDSGQRKYQIQNPKLPAGGRKFQITNPKSQTNSKIQT